MSKHAVEAFAGALRAEMAPWKIAVSVLNPGILPQHSFNCCKRLSFQTREDVSFV